MSVLERHGTKAFVLKPSSVVAAAEHDLGRRHDRRATASAPYAFHRRHVARASCPLDLIDRAIADRYTGYYCGKRVARILYGEDGLLEAARALISPIGAEAAG
jgi:hypothetical protein